MTTKTIHTERIDGRLVGLPVDIEQPDIKAALDKLIELSAVRREAFETRDTASAKLRDALTNEADDIAQALLADTSFTPEGVAQSTLDAQEVARTAQTRLDGIVAARKDGPYTSFHDFLSRVPAHVANKRTVESLIN